MAPRKLYRYRKRTGPWGRLALTKTCLPCLMWSLMLLFVAGQFYVLLLYRGDGATEPPRRIRVFYSVFARDDPDADAVALNDLRALIDEQLAPLLPAHDVRVRAVGRPPDLPPRAQLARYNAAGTDLETLDMLWEYCGETGNEKRKVAYLRLTGSLGATEEAKSALRRFATRGALSVACAAAPDSCDVCASRVSPAPHPHVPGNMVGARASPSSR